jgi:hypothetical protein
MEVIMSALDMQWCLKMLEALVQEQGEDVGEEFYRRSEKDS